MIMVIWQVLMIQIEVVGEVLRLLVIVGSVMLVIVLLSMVMVSLSMMVRMVLQCCGNGMLLEEFLFMVNMSFK